MGKYKKSYSILGIGDGGVYAKEGDNVSVSIPDTRLSSYFGDLKEGGIVIDKRPCVDHPDFVRMVINGPMLKEALPPGHKDNFGEISPCDNPEKAGWMTYVSLDLYLKLWEKLGAKIGKRIKNKIKWNDGTMEVIPPWKERFSVKG